LGSMGTRWGLLGSIGTKWGLLGSMGTTWVSVGFHWDYVGVFWALWGLGGGLLGSMGTGWVVCWAPSAARLLYIHRW
jgi:hypothetical protein